MNIYIGNLSYRVRESDLQQVLEEYGIVDSVKLIVDRDTRRSKGFAFAEMPNVDEAQKAIEELNQAEYEGRQIHLKITLKRGDDSLSAFLILSIIVVYLRTKNNTTKK